MVLHGALAVRRTGDLEPLAELRAGELVGEIGFFANVPRTADVIAIRDTSVLVLTRAAYQDLAEDAPAIVEALLAALARRFAKETARLTPIRASPKARTVALIDGGHEPLPGAFDRRMRDGLAAIDAEIVDPARVNAMFPGRALGCARSGRLAQQTRTRRAAGGLPRRSRSFAMGAQGYPPGRHGCVRVPWRCARGTFDGCRGFCLRGSSQRRRDASFAFMTGGAVKSAAPRPGLPGCRPSCITMSLSKIRLISTV